MRIFLFLFILSNVYALDINDKINNVSVIKHYKKNFLVLNRGLEDGIDKFDHIKLTNKNGYIARAICVRSSMVLSYWKVYRVVHPELLSYDSNYRINSMRQSELPPRIKLFMSKLDKDAFADKQITEKELNREVELQQERIANFDLINDMNKAKVYKVEDTEAQKFSKRNFNSSVLSKDLSSTKLRLFASPIRFQSEDDEKSSNYGFNLYNTGSKYQFKLDYNKIDEKAVNNITKEEVTTEQTLAEGEFRINRISENFSYFGYMKYNQRKEGDIYFPKSHTQIGVLGFIYHFYSEKDDTQFDIGYITLTDNLESDVTKPKSDSIKEDNVRHALRVQLATSLSDNWKFKSTLWYKPLIDMDKLEMDWSDNKTNLQATLSYNMTERFYISYHYDYLDDIRRKRDFDRDSTITTNTFNMNYLISL